MESGGAGERESERAGERESGRARERESERAGERESEGAKNRRDGYFLCLPLSRPLTLPLLSLSGVRHRRVRQDSLGPQVFHSRLVDRDAITVAAFEH